jgi:hypothetical protein
LINQLKKKDFILGLIVQIWAIYLYSKSLTFPVADRGYAGPASFPRFIAYAAFFLACIVMVKALLNKNGEQISFSKDKLKALGLVFIVAVQFVIYLVGVKYFYFIPTTIVFLFVLVLTVRKTIRFNIKEYLQMLVFSVLTSFILYFVFVKVLNIYLK